MGALYAAVDMHTVPWIGARPELKREDRLESLDIAKMLLARVVRQVSVGSRDKLKIG